MLVLASALALVIGVVLGTLGGGGAILMLPMLVYALHLEPKTAIATSPSWWEPPASSGRPCMRARNVNWRVGGFFGLASMAGAFAGRSRSDT